MMERIPALRLAATGASTGLVSIALVLLFRRVSGAPLRDLNPGEAVVYTALFAAAASFVARRLAEFLPKASRSPTAGLLTSLLLTLAFLAGLTTDPVTILAGTFVAAGTLALPALSDRHTAADAPTNAPVMPGHEPLVTPNDDAVLHDDPRDAQIELVRTADGTCDRIAGAIRFDLDAGETFKTLHVPLWPSLAAEPMVRCDLEGLDGRVSVPYAKPHGFRIEVRLPEAIDEPLEGVVRFVAECPARSVAA